jgi:hypothetical protein
MGKQLVKMVTEPRKEKILTMRNSHKNHYWKDADNSFVEDIELFQFLTGRGFVIPTAGNEKVVVVVDSFTLMPAWINELPLIARN